MRLLQLLPSLSGCVCLFRDVHWCAGVCVGGGYVRVTGCYVECHNKHIILKIIERAHLHV